MRLHRTIAWVGPCLVGALLLSSGCREHPQREGTYSLSALEVARDTCGLWASGALRPDTITLSTPGNEVFAELSPPTMPMWGRFLWEGHAFRVAGTLAAEELEVEGAACELSLIQGVLEGETGDRGAVVGARLSGQLTLETQGRIGGACDCLVVVEVEGVLQEL